VGAKRLQVGLFAGNVNQHQLVHVIADEHGVVRVGVIMLQ
jgi:hypothetical protein